MLGQGYPLSSPILPSNQDEDRCTPPPPQWNSTRHVHDIQLAVCLLRSRGRTFLLVIWLSSFLPFAKHLKSHSKSIAECSVSWLCSKIPFNELFPKMTFTKFSKFIELFSQKIPFATYYVIDRDVSWEQTRRRSEGGSSNWPKFMFRLFLRFPQLAEFTESSAPFEKNLTVLTVSFFRKKKKLSSSESSYRCLNTQQL